MTEWKERANSKELTSDLDTHAVAHACPHIYTYTINTCKNNDSYALGTYESTVLVPLEKNEPLRIPERMSESARNFIMIR